MENNNRPNNLDQDTLTLIINNILTEGITLYNNSNIFDLLTEINKQENPQCNSLNILLILSLQPYMDDYPAIKLLSQTLQYKILTNFLLTQECSDNNIKIENNYSTNNTSKDNLDNINRAFNGFLQDIQEKNEDIASTCGKIEENN